jgi:hypothetical protein
MFRQFVKTFTVSLFAKIAAGVVVAVLAALGYFNVAGAYLIAWAANVTPETARIVFWAIAAALVAGFLILPAILGPRRRDLWAERDQLELSAIACLSVGKTADQPYDVEPQLSRHRLLKDAIRNGSLKFVDIAGDKPNVHTLVSRENLRAYATATSNSDLLDVVAKWDRINPPRKPQQISAPLIESDDVIHPPTSTQYVPADIPARLFMKGWLLDFNPKTPRGKKELVFNVDGTFGEGGNKNEFRWQMKNGLLEIYRESKLLQNRFRYDPASGKFTCTNDPDAEGYKDQTIYRLKND